MEEEKGKFYREDVVVTDEEARRIEEKTRAQASSDLWKKERLKRLTASHVGGISKMRKTTKRSGKVRELLYTVFTGSKATRFGTLNEEVARQEYVTKQRENGHAGLQTTACGLVIHPDTPWLAASPDGRVEDPSVAEPLGLGLIEIKNPYSVRFSTINEACSSKIFCLQRKEEAGRERLICTIGVHLGLSKVEGCPHVRGGLYGGLHCTNICPKPHWVTLRFVKN